MIEVKVKKLDENAKIPTKGSVNSAGYDLYACLKEDVEIKPGNTVKIKTGIAIELPTSYVGLIFARSGLSIEKNLAPANKVGVCDSDYRGEYIVALRNGGDTSYIVKNGDRIAQLVVVPVLSLNFKEVENLSETKRGENGFGSTGV